MFGTHAKGVSFFISKCILSFLFAFSFLSFFFNFLSLFFSCVHATLHSLCLLVGQSVVSLVTLYFLVPFFFYLTAPAQLASCMAPAHPYTTLVAVYAALFSFFLSIADPLGNPPYTNLSNITYIEVSTTFLTRI